MVYARYLEEAYSIVQSVAKSCGTVPEMEEALAILSDMLEHGGWESDLEYAAQLLRDAADMLRQRRCLDWYSLEIAADTLEHAG